MTARSDGRSMKLWRRAKKIISANNILLAKRADMSLANERRKIWRSSMDCDLQIDTQIADSDGRIGLLLTRAGDVNPSNLNSLGFVNANLSRLQNCMVSRTEIGISVQEVVY